MVTNTAGHHPSRRGVEQEKALLGALIRVPSSGDGNLLDDVLDFIHDIGRQGRNQVIIAVIGGDDTVTTEQSLNVLKINFGHVLVEHWEANMLVPRGGQRQ